MVDENIKKENIKTIPRKVMNLTRDFYLENLGKSKTKCASSTGVSAFERNGEV